MPSSTAGIKSVIRESVRTTIHNTLASVIQEVTEEELRTALKTKNFREPLMEMIQSELQLAIKELANAPGPDRFSPRLFLKRANTAFAYHAGCL